MADDERVNVGMRLSKKAVAKLDAASDRLGKSRAVVNEILIALHADALTGDTEIPLDVFPSGGRAKRTEKKPRRKS